MINGKPNLASSGGNTYFLIFLILCCTILFILLAFPKVRRSILGACHKCFLNLPRLLDLASCFQSSALPPGYLPQNSVASFRRYADDYSNNIRMRSRGHLFADTQPLMPKDDVGDDDVEKGGSDDSGGSGGGQTSDGGAAKTEMREISLGEGEEEGSGSGAAKSEEE